MIISPFAVRLCFRLGGVLVSLFLEVVEEAVMVAEQGLERLNRRCFSPPRGAQPTLALPDQQTELHFARRKRFRLALCGGMPPFRLENVLHQPGTLHITLKNQAKIKIQGE
jgi:hypothetical protein